MLTKRQYRQKAAIDAEIKELNIDFISQSTRNVICVAEFADSNRWFGIVDDAERDIKKFGIERSSDYIREMLKRAGIYGVTTRSPRDDHDAVFGVFVAKARLLKHIKKERVTDD